MALHLCKTLASFILEYPEILLSIACFSILFLINTGNRLPVTWPVVGMIPYLVHAPNLHDWLTDILRKSHCTFIFKGPWFCSMDLLLTCDPANINHVFNSNFTNYHKDQNFSEIFDILGDGIFNADHDSWMFQRRKAHALINNKRFKAFVAQASHDKVKRSLVPLLNHLAEKDELFDLQDVIMRLTLDLTCFMILGIDPCSLSIGFPSVPFAKAIDDAEEALFYRHVTPLTWKWIRFTKEKKLANAWKTIDHFIMHYISQRRSSTHENTKTKGDLLSSYLESEEEVAGLGLGLGLGFDKFLRDTTLNLMLAGRDTTSSALTWFFWLVATHPQVETKILNELKVKAYSLDKAYQNNDNLHCLIYLHAALLESLRLYPPVPFEHKGVHRKDVLPSGEQVDDSRMVVVSLYAMGRMEGIWGMDCMEFKPERWISESGKIKHEPSYKYFVFNCGPRSCLGRELAFTQMKAMAAAMIKSFVFKVKDGHVPRPKISILLHMKDGLMVRVRKRDEDEEVEEEG
ncbi:Cytochrome P450 E-class group I protein [Dioscorea alata]|uniref:Cytochrome P450 E-class group I protein n=1 Tax=Dioscorea alata TaxID=55571 RepID=A0ACB7UAT8_DIOAL|nr:Cytochrome P450 E-class group I protein [Dioscorea alata]